MKTLHKLICGDSSNMDALASDSVDLVVTSPPYPMIAMWDNVFARQNPKIIQALESGRGDKAFEMMHQVLDLVWNEIYRVLKTGGLACINIGDATRTINEKFSLYANHARILSHFIKTGFNVLPEILWRKQTNAPNKFMGSGMLPAGAYVTLEHEFILIVRKGGKREFIKPDAKENRRESAFFWEERNTWFSDIWMDLKGARQKTNSDKIRKRSGAFPFELPYRLINMYSAKGDTVLDPFAGLGTTVLAAMAAGRNSVGYEINRDFCNGFSPDSYSIVEFANQRLKARIKDHEAFIKNRFEQKGGFKYKNKHHGFPVITNQEKNLFLNQLKSAARTKDNVFEVTYFDKPEKSFAKDWDGFFIEKKEPKSRPKARPSKKKQDGHKQTRMFD